VVEQEIPGLLIQQRTVHYNEGVVCKGAVQIEIACDLLFAGAGLAVDEYRLAQQGEGAYLGRLSAHRAAEAVEAVGEEVFALALVQGAQAGTAGMERDAGRNTVEQIPLDVVHQQLLGGDAVELVPLGVVKAEIAAGRYLSDVGLKDAAQLRRDLGDAAVEEVTVGLHDDDAAILALGDAAEEQVLLPQMAEPGADVHGLVDGGVEAFDAGGDEEGVEAHLPGDGVGDHVTDHHPVAALLQAFQGVAHLSSVVHGEDVEVEVQQTAQGVSRLGDGGKAHDGVEAGIILGQLHGAQHVVHRDVDVHHRQVGHLPDEGGGATAGDDAVVGVGGHLLHDGLPVFQVAGVNVHFNIGISLRRLLHRGAHSVVGGDAQNTGVSLYHNGHLRSYLLLF